MQAKSVYKVPNGKLLKISLHYDEIKHVVTDIQITGDFFAYPEEAIELIEDAVRQTTLTKDHLLQTIERVINEHHIEFIGVDAEGLTEGIMRCVT
ncbi:MAG: hypothetical protein JW771_03885 [Candidatus Thermoplasmatota archaeon]|nr:hypothetical protein [Candidatus Thermoplasmatota archaeon]